jgi:hypothetical protein
MKAERSYFIAIPTLRNGEEEGEHHAPSYLTEQLLLRQGFLLWNLNHPLFGLSRILFFCPLDVSHYEL